MSCAALHQPRTATSLQSSGNETGIGPSVASWLGTIGKPVGDLLTEHTKDCKSLAEFCGNTAKGSEDVSTQHDIDGNSDDFSTLSDTSQNWVGTRFNEETVGNAIEIMRVTAVSRFQQGWFQSQALIRQLLRGGISRPSRHDQGQAAQHCLHGLYYLPKELEDRRQQDVDTAQKMATIVRRMTPSQAFPILITLMRLQETYSSRTKIDAPAMLGLNTIRLLLDWDSEHPAQDPEIGPAGQHSD